VKYGSWALQSHAVRRPWLIALLAGLLALGLVAGCGDDDGGGNGGDDAAEVKEEFSEAYRPINDDFLALGAEVGQAVQTAKGKSNSEITRTFGGFAEKVTEIRARLDALEPPPELEADAKRLSNAMALVGDDVRQISVAAATGNAEEARTQAQELVRHSVEVRTARRALARKTGAKV
jgi:hypothetical protein